MAASHYDPAKAQLLFQRFADPKSKVPPPLLLSRRYEQLLRTEKFFDCVFRVTDDKCQRHLVRCHKLILSAASPVFEAMFYGPIREKQLEIDIDDMSRDAFERMIQYIYTGVVAYDTLTLEDTFELYYGAEKYLLMDLSGDCLTQITSKLRYTNIIPALELSVCLDLQELRAVCMTFFRLCCIDDAIFINIVKSSDRHMSKECIKGIIAANPDEQKKLLWLVREWCQRECAELGLQRVDRSWLIDDLQLNNELVNLMADYEARGASGGATHGTDTKRKQYLTVQRSYFKASAPFVIDRDQQYGDCKWRMSLQSDRFISLMGIVMPCRLQPAHTLSPRAAMQCILDGTSPTEYSEQFRIEISVMVPQTQLTTQSSDDEDDDDDEEEEDGTAHERRANEPAKGQWQVIWSHRVNQSHVKYNSDLHIQWDDGVNLAPDMEYVLEIIWEPQHTIYAEYPCSLLSGCVNGIRFREHNYDRCLVKGLYYLKLVPFVAATGC